MSIAVMPISAAMNMTTSAIEEKKDAAIEQMPITKKNQTTVGCVKTVSSFKR
jgi:hypothetical protein